MTRNVNKDLLRAVLEPRKPGALKAISDSCSAGADPDAICPECSTPTGPVTPGSTLLTHSVHNAASNAVEKLLQCGADPNLADQHGWTPWMASTLLDGSKRVRIQSLLEQHGADKTGEHIGELVRAVYDGDVDRAAALFETDKDQAILSTFRVDLVGHQIAIGNTAMLQLLLERQMTPNSTNFLNTIRLDNLAALDVLLRHGVSPERPDHNETPLMTAAAIGNLQIVQRLVEAGADVNRYADGNPDWTPSFYARKAGKTDVADWLAVRMSKGALDLQHQREASRDPAYQLLYEQATATESLSTDDLARLLSKWNDDYGVAVNDAKGDSLDLVFESLPADLDAFVVEILDICPDAVDYERDLRKELKNNKRLFLWWD